MPTYRLLFVCLIWFCNSGCAQSSTPAAEETAESTFSILEGMAFVTHDLDRSIEFYQRYLGYTLYKRIEIDNVGILSAFGLEPGTRIDYAAMLPPGFSKDKPSAAINFAQINAASADAMTQAANRPSLTGEVMLAFEVDNLVTKSSAMQAAGVTLITEPIPSQTGRSITVTVLDPNGVRLQLFEYLKRDEQ